MRTFPATSFITSYANPGGVGNRSGLITLTSTFTASAGSAAALINGTFATGYIPNVQSSGYWLFDFLGIQKFIDEITWYQDIAGTQGTLLLEGSNDGISFDTIQQNIIVGMTPTQIIPLKPNTTNTYSIFRLSISNGSLKNTANLLEVEFKIADASMGIITPACDFQSNNTVTFTIQENEFGDGYSQRNAAGINNMRDSWAATWTNITTQEKNTIVKFIREQQGWASFHWLAPGDLVVNQWTARDLKIQPIDAGYWTVTSTFRMEFDL